MKKTKARVRLKHLAPSEEMTLVYVVLNPTTYIATMKALAHLKPEYNRAGYLKPEQVCEDINTLLTAACEGVFQLKATHAVNQAHPKKPDKEIMVHTFHRDCWPPAFTAREETEDEQFARMVTAAY